MNFKMANPDHEVAYQDLIALVAKHSSRLTPLEILAVASNMLGKLLAMQDQRTTSVEEAKEVIARNMEFGNQQVVDALMRSAGNG